MKGTTVKAKDIKVDDKTRYVLDGKGIRGSVVTVVSPEPCAKGRWNVRSVASGVLFDASSREIIREVKP